MNLFRGSETPLTYGRQTVAFGFSLIMVHRGGGACNLVDEPLGVPILQQGIYYPSLLLF